MRQSALEMIKSVSDRAKLVAVWHDQIGVLQVPDKLTSIMNVMRDHEGTDYGQIAYEDSTYILSSYDVKLLIGGAAAYASTEQQGCFSIVEDKMGSLTIGRSKYPFDPSEFYKSTIVSSNSAYKEIIDTISNYEIYNPYKDINIKKFFGALLQHTGPLKPAFETGPAPESAVKKGKKQVTGETQRVTVTLKNEAVNAAKSLASDNGQTLGLYLSEVLERDPEIMQRIAENRRAALRKMGQKPNPRSSKSIT